MGKKLSYEYVKTYFEVEGYTLLSSEYINAHQKLECLCPHKHKITITWHKFRQGRRCKYCNGSAIYFKDIKKMFEKENYLLLTTEEDYKTTKQLLLCECPNGHQYYVSYNNWKRGYRCRKCFINSNRVSYYLFLELLKKKRYVSLSSNIKDFTSKTNVCCRCEFGHIFTTSWNKLQQGYGCKKCAYNTLSRKFKLKYFDVMSNISKEGYKLLSSEYINAQDKLVIKCPNNHIYKTSWNTWQQGCRCPKCSNNYSKGHKDVVDFCSSYGYTVKINDRSLITPYELDIVIPSKKIAIEYCGLYWHSELMGKDSIYHLHKLDLCNKIGYRLITMFEDEWINKKIIVQSRLLDILNNKFQVVIDAGRCNVQELSTEEAKFFCENNHIQGYGRNNDIKLGLFCNTELVAVMTFSKLLKSIELHRFCFKLNTKIIGGAEKLLKYFIYNCNTKYNKIFSYVDRRWSIGTLYEKLGFTFDSNTKPNCWYLNKNNNKRKYKDDLRKQYKNSQNTKEYNKVWDCGNIKYIKIINCKEM